MLLTVVIAFVGGAITYGLTLWVRAPLVEAGLVTAVGVEHEARALAVGMSGIVGLIGIVLSVLAKGDGLP